MLSILLVGIGLLNLSSRFLIKVTRDCCGLEISRTSIQYKYVWRRRTMPLQQSCWEPWMTGRSNKEGCVTLFIISDNLGDFLLWQRKVKDQFSVFKPCWLNWHGLNATRSYLHSTCKYKHVKLFQVVDTPMPSTESAYQNISILIVNTLRKKRESMLAPYCLLVKENKM